MVNRKRIVDIEQRCAYSIGYSIFVTLVYGSLAVRVYIATLQLNFIIITSGTQYIIWMYSRSLHLHNNVHSLGSGFRAFVGILIYHFIVNLLSIIFFFAPDDYFIQMEDYPWFGALPVWSWSKSGFGCFPNILGAAYTRG